MIQARTGSTRLPNKVLFDLVGKTVLERTVCRVSSAASVNKLLVATSVKSSDDVIADICQSNKVFCFRGSEEDVLDRYYQIAQMFGAREIIRICADSPFIDPAVIDKAVSIYLSSGADYVSTMTLGESYPRGQHVEVFSASVLSEAWNKAMTGFDREHVTPYIWGRPNEFKLVPVVNSGDFSKYKMDIDTMEDYMRARKVQEKLGEEDYCWLDVVSLLDLLGDR